LNLLDQINESSMDSFSTNKDSDPAKLIRFSFIIDPTSPELRIRTELSCLQFFDDLVEVFFSDSED